MESETPPPGCLLALVSLAEPMAQDVLTPVGDVPAAFAARYVLDFLLDGLAAAGPFAEGLEIGVYGYRRTPDGLTFDWLLPTPEPEGALAPFATLLAAEVPTRAEGQPRKWIRAEASAGEAAPAAALSRAHRVLAWWAARHADARPPVFIHCATEDGADATSEAVVRAIRSLAVRGGCARILEWTFVPGTDAGFPSDDVWNMLFDHPEGRPIVEVPTEPAFTVERSFWSQKRGNDPGQWEDAFAVGDGGTVAAVCDGASEGIFCRDWAARLASRFVADRPDLADRAAVAAWITAARNDWRAAINYPQLRWSQQNKVNETGASATLIGVEFGPATADDVRTWRATAIGDACLVHITPAGEWLSFPLTAAEQFNSAPALLRTKLGLVPPPAAFAAGTCRAGDLFLLATDAVAGRLLVAAARGEANWDSYATKSPDEWLAEFDELRDSGNMVNDDCTLLVLRVAPGVPAERADSTEIEQTQGGVTLTPLGAFTDDGHP